MHHEKREITLAQAVSLVESFGVLEADALMEALQRRYQKLCPGWIVVFEACPIKKPDHDRKTSTYASEERIMPQLQ